MDLDAQIDLRPHRFTQAANVVDRRLDLVGVRLVIRRGLIFIEQRVQVPERRETLRLQPLCLTKQRFDRAALHVAVDPRLVPHLAAEKFIDRHAVIFALDVPQRDVDSRNRAGDRAAGEMIGPQHDVPVVLDRARIFAHQVFTVFRDGRGAGFQLTPRAGLANACDTGVGLDPDEQETVHQQGCYFSDLHCVCPFLQAMRCGASAVSLGSMPMPGSFGALTVPSSFSRSVLL